jgi:hypothetical protein
MILCHIIGINNKIKQSFITELKNINQNIDIIDIDIISKKIIFEKQYNILYDEYLQSSNKIQSLSKLSTYWKNRLTNEIQNMISDKDIILIGMITFYLDLRVKINLSEEIKNKFFINSNTELHIKNLIEHNLDMYRKDIIDGNFPLKYLDFEFLKSQRENIRDVYMMRDYKLKSYDEIIEFVKNKIKLQQGGNNKSVYFASFKRYEDHIDFISNTIVGYSDKWLALISLFSRNKFSRGITFKENKSRPFIKELQPLQLNELKKCCYLYEMTPSEKVDEYRYLIESNKFIKRLYISNIKLELDLYDTIYEKYSFSR